MPDLLLDNAYAHSEFDELSRWANLHLFSRPLFFLHPFPSTTVLQAGSWLPVMWASLSVVYGFEVMCVSLGSSWMTLCR